MGFRSRTAYQDAAVSFPALPNERLLATTATPLRHQTVDEQRQGLDDITERVKRMEVMPLR